MQYILHRLTIVSMILFASIIISCSSTSNSISNVPVDIYVTGRVYISRMGAVAVYWKNGKMTVLHKDDSNVESIAISGKDVYAGGSIMELDPIQRDGNGEAEFIHTAGYWKNGKWTLLNRLNPRNSSEVEKIFVHGNDVYACGYIKKIDFTIPSEYSYARVTTVGYWKNGKWVGLSTSTETEGKYVWESKPGAGIMNDLIVSGSDVYACGYVKRSGTEIPVYWKNGVLVELPFLTGNKFGSASSIFVSNNDVYVFGKSDDESGKAKICYWENGKIKTLPSSKVDYTLQVKSFFVSGKDIYIGGYSGDYSSYIAGYLKNGKWIALKSPDGFKRSKVNALTVFGKDVYAAGYYVDNKGNEKAGYWKNEEWFGYNADVSFDPVSSIVVVPRPISQ